MAAADNGASAKPKLEHTEGSWSVTLPGDAEPFNVLSWQPPRLILERDGELRCFQIAATDGGHWLGRLGQVTKIETSDPTESERRRERDARKPRRCGR